MADADRTLEVLLKLRADTAEATTQLNGALKDVQAQAVETAASVEAITAGGLPGDNRGALNYQALAAERVAATEQLNALDAEGVAIAQAQAAEKARIALQTERQLILTTEIEAAEAKLAGNPALAARLEQEAEIRARALGIQRTLNVSTGEAIILAERLVLAQEAGVAPTAAVGVNLARAQGEALTMARHLATGHVNTRSMAALMGSFGTAVSIAGIGLFVLYEVFAHIKDLSKELNDELQKQTEEIEKQSSKWQQMAETASSLKDGLKLDEAMLPTLDAAEKKLEEIGKKPLGIMQSLTDSIDLTAHSDELAAAMDKQAGKVRELLETMINLRAETQQFAVQWERIKSEPFADGLTEASRIMQEQAAKAEQLVKDREAV